MARAATSRRSSSHRPPESAWIWLVERMQTAMSEASRLVETASREPLGISFTWLTISMPWPGRPVSVASSSARGRVEPSMPDGTRPEAITAALSSPR